MRLSSWACRCFFLVSFPSLHAAPGRGLTVRDLVQIQRVSDPTPSPDGKTLVLQVSSVDLEKNGRTSDLWRVGIQGEDPRPLTGSLSDEGSPVWTPDGRSLLFLSNRTGTQQVWRLSLSGGEARQVTRFPLDVSSFLLSPDGASLAFSAHVFPECKTLDCTHQKLDALKTRSSSGMLFERLFIRHWDEWKTGQRQHLFVVPLTGSGGADAPPLTGTGVVDVMAGMDADCPTRPFGDQTDYAFAPDSLSLIFVARDEGRQEAWSTNLDLFEVPVDGSRPPARLTAANLGTDTGPVFSPDGRTLAYRAMPRAGYEADRYQIRLRSWPDGGERLLAPDWDRSADSLVWSADGKTLYVTADNLGQISLFALDVKTGRVRTLVRDGHASGVAVAGKNLVLTYATLQKPAEVFSLKPDGTSLQRLTGLNSDLLAGISMGVPEQFTFPGWNGETVHAWTVCPPDYVAGKKYPVAFTIHGGPQGSSANTFHYRWNAQVLAGAGYGVVMVDFHGSTGYGQAFTDSIRGDWGGKPLEDLQKGLEAALARYPWMDGSRVCALGASYGGYMINWIAGQWPDRFKCLVNHDGNLDERMAYFDTEELWFPEWDHQGVPWEHPEHYSKHNPIDFVQNWKTPMLVIHGAKDFRVVDTQGISTFTALQRRGIPSQFLYFPDENHWVLKPRNSILWYDTVLAWMQKWSG